MRKEFAKSYEPRPKIKRPPGHGASTDSVLRAYFQAMGEVPTLTPDQEQDVALELRTARGRRWSALLGYPPLVPSIRKLIDERLELDRELVGLLDHVGVSAEHFRVHRSSTAQVEFLALCEQAGARLSEIDTDSELAELLVADLERIVANQRERLTLEIARMPGASRPFRNYHEQVRERADAVRRHTNRFAKANLRLVVSLARRLAHGRMPLQDVIQEGNIGLLKAIERFDHRRGFRFSTYASWWIRHAISRAIYNKARQVRLPVHVHDVQQKISRTRRMFEAEHGREPSAEELAEAIDVPVAKIQRITRLQHGPIVSLDAPSSRGDDRSGVELLEDHHTPSPGLHLEAIELDAGLADALANLRPMEADILRRRYGLEGIEQETLREIGERYALSRERIRQLQERALSHLRDEFSRRSLL